MSELVQYSEQTFESISQFWNMRNGAGLLTPSSEPN